MLMFEMMGGALSDFTPVGQDLESGLDVFTGLDSVTMRRMSLFAVFLWVLFSFYSRRFTFLDPFVQQIHDNVKPAASLHSRQL